MKWSCFSHNNWIGAKDCAQLFLEILLKSHRSVSKIHTIARHLDCKTTLMVVLKQLPLATFFVQNTLADLAQLSSDRPGDLLPFPLEIMKHRAMGVMISSSTRWYHWQDSQIWLRFSLSFLNSPIVYSVPYFNCKVVNVLHSSVVFILIYISSSFFNSYRRCSAWCIRTATERAQLRSAKPGQ